jgi:hypothetical protein
MPRIFLGRIQTGFPSGKTRHPYGVNGSELVAEPLRTYEESQRPGVRAHDRSAETQKFFRRPVLIRVLLRGEHLLRRTYQNRLTTLAETVIGVVPRAKSRFPRLLEKLRRRETEWTVWQGTPRAQGGCGHDCSRETRQAPATHLDGWSPGRTCIRGSVGSHACKPAAH